MKIKNLFTLFLALMSSTIWAQSYTNYYTGSFGGITTNPEGGICMMGGATEHDEAMKWFLERADGGDVLVLRTSGSDGYNDYMHSELGVNVNSVETIVFNSATAANESYIHQKIQGAEAIWFAGGDQWNYISYWRGTMIETLINEAIQERNIVIGGTSAGMAILSKYYFSAENGTVTSAQALSNPYNNDMTVDSTHFLENQFLEEVITDTHYDDPDRKGRHFAFLSRMVTDFGFNAKGIACNEYTAVCIDENGMARVYGDYPNYEEAAYFLQTNCEVTDNIPENCSANNPLEWNQNSSAVKVYKIYGTNNGANTFDLNNWETGEGGIWQNWYVTNGNLIETSSSIIDCPTVGVEDLPFEEENLFFPNPISTTLTFNYDVIEFSIYNLEGKLILNETNIRVNQSIDVSFLASGMYLLTVNSGKGIIHYKVIKE